MSRCARCPPSRTRASACASRSSCARWRARTAGPAPPSARPPRAGLRAAARLDRWPAGVARQLRARPARARPSRARRRAARARGPVRPRTRASDATRGTTALTVIAPPLELPDAALGGGGEVAARAQRLRSGGHELHGVREHQPGESLRGVHWPATAHRGRLMVKELDDPAGDQLAIVLDARGRPMSARAGLELRAGGGCGRRPRRAGAADARRVRLVVAGGDGEPASASERTAVRRLLARARPAGERPPGRPARAPRGRAHRGRDEPAGGAPRRRPRAPARRRRDRPVELRPRGAPRRRSAGSAGGGRVRVSS